MEKESEPSPSGGSTPSTNIPKKIIANYNQIVGLASWIAKPLIEVGNQTSDLRATPAARDSVSRIGSGSANFTSWESVSRSYVGCLSNLGVSSTVRARPKKTTTWKGDTPTAEEEKKMSRADLALLKRHGAVFIRAKNMIITRAQQGEDKYIRIIQDAHKPAPVSHVTKVNLPATSKEKSSEESAQDESVETRMDYSATVLPVRCAQVTTWRTEEQVNMSVPYSPSYSSIVQRLADPNAAGALGAVVRAPSIRDGSTLISLAAHMTTDHGSIMEIAPITRIACMGLSVAADCYDLDPIQYRFARGFVRDKTQAIATYIDPDPPIPVSQKIMAISVDLFTSFMIDKSGPLDQDGNYNYQNADVTWTAVPIRAAMLNQQYAVPYIAGFAGSSSWNGRVCHIIRGKYEGGNISTDHEMTLVPTVNSTYIPGAANILLVLLDSTASFPQTNLTLEGNGIPCYTNAPVQPIPFNPIFSSWYKTDNVDRIPRDCAAAINEVSSKLGVENSTLLGLSLAAELYAAQYQGIDIPITPDPIPQPNWDATSMGGYLVSSEDGVLPGTRIKCRHMNTSDVGQAVVVVRKLNAYNFTSISPFCLPPTGYSAARTKTFDSDVGVFWNSSSPTSYSYNYNITTANSVARIGIAMGLVNTNESVMVFNYGGGFANWMHMLSCALSAQTCTIFTSTNLNLAIWSGYQNLEDGVFATLYMQQAIKLATGGLANYHQYRQIVDSWNASGGFDPDMLIQYHELDIWEDSNWMSNHPLPFYFVAQWLEKHKSFKGEFPGHPVNWYHNRTSHIGLSIDQNSLDSRFLVVGSHNVDTYCPIVVAQTMTEASLSHMDLWIDEFAYITNTAAKSSNINKKGLLTTQTCVISPVDSGLSYTPDFNVYVIGSAYENLGDERRNARFTQLLYPDPPPLSDIISSAKHWLLYPGLSALGGYVTGGPVGALAAGGTHLVKNLAEKFLPQDSLSTVSNVVGQISKNLANPLPETTPSLPQAVAAQILNPEKYHHLPISPTPSQTQPVPPTEPLISVSQPPEPTPPSTPPTLTTAQEHAVVSPQT